MIPRNSTFDTLSCPHCSVKVSVPGDIFVPFTFLLNSMNEEEGGGNIKGGHCPNCGGLILELFTGELDRSFSTHDPILKSESKIVLYPRQSRLPALSVHVPDTIVKLYTEAYEVLFVSPTASAALSRRLLQQIFHDTLGINGKNLNAEIDLFIQDPDVPRKLANMIDHVRTLGNFAAHPIKSVRTGEIVDVEIGEAEESLLLLERVIEFAYVYPATEAERRNRFNEKLRESNKPDLKARKA